MAQLHLKYLFTSCQLVKVKFSLLSYLGSDGLGQDRRTGHYQFNPAMVRNFYNGV